MAAILCESFGKLLNGVCDAVGAVCSLPFRVCGLASGQVTKLCRSPFCLYLTVAVGLNLPPVVFTGMAWSGGRNGDEGCISASNWMLLNSLLCVINMVAALYISAKITYEPEGDANAAPFVEASVFNNEAKTDATTPVKKTNIARAIMESTITDTQSRSISRVKEILCYDPLVALYIIIGVFYVVWQTMGAARSGDAEGCGDDFEDYLRNSIMCGFLFVSLGATTFACSLCCVVRK